MAESIYKDTRKKHDMTRDEVCDKASELNYPLQPERLERVENGKYPITPELVLKCATGSTAVFEQHIMHALLECGMTDKIYGDLYYELFSPESPENVLVKVGYPEPSEVIEAIHEAGGIAVLAHPASSDCIELMEELAEKGELDGIEVTHPENTAEQQDALKKFAKSKESYLKKVIRG